MEDRIERRIQIQAPLTEVWTLISQAGWWVTESTTGSPTSSTGTTLVASAPGTVVPTQTESGTTFPVLVVAMDEPRTASFRWASQFPGEELTDTNSTLIEFTLTPSESGVEVVVVETGFAGLAASPEVREAGYTDNSGGWEQMLAWADRQLTA